MFSEYRSRLIRAILIMFSLMQAACTEIGLRAVSVPSQLFGDMRVDVDLRYGEKSHQLLDLYRPASTSNETGRLADKRLIVFIYGGNWTSGSKAGYYFVADALTSAGYTVAIPDYVKYPQGVFPEFVSDIALAVDWLAGTGGPFEHTEQLILMGHSAGAHTAALLVTDPRYLDAYQFPQQRITAFIGLSGPYAYLPENQKYRDIFGDLADYHQMQPLNFVSGSEPSMLLLHGEDDTTVLPLHTKKFADKAQSQGVAVGSHLYSGRGHASLVLALSRLQEPDNSVREAIVNFLQQLD